MALQYQRSSAPRKILSDVLIKMGFEKRYIHRSLTVYEKHYNVMHIGYNIPILKEIIFRIKIKDILKDSQITYHSKVNLHHALESMDFSSELIRSALQIYDDEHQSDSSHAYILKDICSILMQLRANRFHKQQMQQHTADNSLDTKDSGTTNNISINNYHDAEMYYKNTNLTRDTDIHTNWRDLRSLQYKPSKLDLPEHKTRITTYTSYEKLQLAMKSVSSNGIEDSQMISEFNSPKQVLSQSGVTSTVMPSPSPPIVISVPPSIPRIIMNEQGSLDGYNLLKSDCKLRHFVLIWLPVLDILTDMMIISAYIKSATYVSMLIGYVLCAILWVAMRLQPMFFVMYHLHGRVVDQLGTWQVFVMYIPVFPPFVMVVSLMIEMVHKKSSCLVKFGVYLCCVPVGICGCLIVEIVLVIGIVLYPLFYMYYAMMAFLTITGYSRRGDEFLNLNDLFDEHYLQSISPQTGAVYKLTDFGFIQFINQWENTLESLLQLVAQIYVYLNYSEYSNVPVWLFVTSVSISGCSVLRVLLKICLCGCTHWSYKTSKWDPPDKQKSFGTRT
eukprot:11676_1